MNDWREKSLIYIKCCNWRLSKLGLVVFAVFLAISSFAGDNILGPLLLDGQGNFKDWKNREAKGQFSFEKTDKTYESAEVYRFVPVDGRASVSLYSPLFSLPGQRLGIASAYLKGKVNARVYVIDGGWKKNDCWNDAKVGGNRIELNNDEFVRVSECFITPNIEASRRFMYRLDIEADQPIEVAMPRLELMPIFGTGLLANPELRVGGDGRKIIGWDQQEVKGRFELSNPEAGVLRLKAEREPVKVVLYAMPQILPADSMFAASVRARGKGKVRLFVTTADWKVDKIWKSGNKPSKIYPLTEEIRDIRFTFPSPSPGQAIRFRIDVESDAAVELEKPRIELINPEEMEESRAQLKGAAELIIAKDFAEGALKKKLDTASFSLLKNNSLKLDFGRTADLASGSLAFWIKPETDYQFSRDMRQLWSLPHTAIDGRMAFARLYLGDRYLSINHRFYAGEWHHLVYTWDSEEGSKIYVDGKIAWINHAPEVGGITDSVIFGGSVKFPAFRADIGAVRVFRGIVSDKEVERLYAEYRPLTLFPMDWAALSGRENLLRISCENADSGMREAVFMATITCPDGQEILRRDLKMSVPPHDFSTTELTFSPKKPGTYRLRLSSMDGESFSYELAVIDSKPISESMPTGEPDLVLIREIDCADVPSENDYRDDGKCIVSDFAGHRFRESVGNSLNSGFAYRFNTDVPGTPHWIEIEYPDDRPRTFYCSIGMINNNRLSSGFLDAFGVITGETFPLSGTYQRKRFFFVPDSKDFAALFCAYYNRHGEKGPAISRIRLYKCASGVLPRNGINPGGREIMIWNEDPTMFAYTWFKQYKWDSETTNFAFLQEKIKRMVYYTRYIGWSSWNMLCNDYLGDNTAGDRRFISSSYSAGGGFLPGHLDMLMVTAERENIPVFLSMNHMPMWNDSPGGFALELGRKAISRNFFHAAARGEEAPELISGNNEMAKVIGGVFNPIHPLVRSTLKRMVDRYVEKFGRYTCFKGLDYQANQPLHFSDADFGYCDYTVNLYRRETASKLPEFSGLKRFSSRKGWLKEHEWEKWLDWRCDKVAELVAELASGLKGRTFIFRTFISKLKNLPPVLDQNKLPDLQVLFREHGIDFSKLSKIPNVCVMPDFRPNYSRTGSKASDECAMNFSDELASLWKIPGIDSAGITMHSTIEIWNNIAGTRIQNLWGDVNSHVSFSITTPNDDYVLENFAWLLAEADPVLINYGWWGNPESGADHKFREFYRAFSYIPKKRFDKVSGVNGPVAVRQSGSDVYAVNLAPFPTVITLKSQEAFMLVDAVTGKNVDIASINIDGHGLRVFRQNKGVAISGVKQSYPDGFKQEIGKKLSEVKKASQLIDRAWQYYRQGRLMAAYRILNSSYLRGEWQSGRYTMRLNVNPADNTLELLTHNNSDKTIAFSVTPDINGGKAKSHVMQPRKHERFSLKTLELLPDTVRKEFRVLVRCGDDSEQLIGAWQPYTAKHMLTPATDGDLSEWNDARWYVIDSMNSSFVLRHKRLSESEHFKARLAFGWNESGLAVAIAVEDHLFSPPKSQEKMWENDMVILYIDQKNDGYGVKSYQFDDMPFRLALMDNKPLVVKGVNAEVCAKSRLAVKHSGKETIYELFIPAETLSEARFEDLGSIGFSFEVINKTQKSGVVVLSTSNEEPHNNPAAWADLVLKK